MPTIPFAVKRLIPAGSNDPKINARIGILHVDATNADSLFDYFKDRSGGIESHGHIKKTGVLEQYRDTAYQADANNLANDFALSFETQGFAEGEWTDEQLATIKRVILWCHDVHGIPLRVVTSWNDPKGGWGYHTLFGAPSEWTPVAKSCPGPARKIQFHNIIQPWLEAGAPTEEDDMADAATQKKLDDILSTVKALADDEQRRNVKRLEREKKVSDALEALAADVSDDATRAQVRRVLDILQEDS